MSERVVKRRSTSSGRWSSGRHIWGGQVISGRASSGAELYPDGRIRKAELPLRGSGAESVGAGTRGAGFGGIEAGARRNCRYAYGERDGSESRMEVGRSLGGVDFGLVVLLFFKFFLHIFISHMRARQRVHGWPPRTLGGFKSARLI